MVPADLPRLPPRTPDGHKGTYGRVLVVGGSRMMAGAAVLAGRAALRGGAGLVRVACPAGVHATVAAGNPCYMAVPLPDDDEGGASAEALGPLREQFELCDVLAVGPGFGRTKGAAAVLKGAADSEKPLVLDADALFAVAEDFSLLKRPAPTLLTPHPGEFARLTKSSAAEVNANRAEAASAFARKYGVVVLLKGNETVVTDGTSTHVNATGNPGMATGGSGDVLTGLLTAVLAQMLHAGKSPLEAARLAAWVHGRAGDLAAAALSQVALTAADLVEYLPAAFLELERAQ